MFYIAASVIRDIHSEREQSKVNISVKDLILISKSVGEYPQVRRPRAPKYSQAALALRPVCDCLFVSWLLPVSSARMGCCVLVPNVSASLCMGKIKIQHMRCIFSGLIDMD